MTYALLTFAMVLFGSAGFESKVLATALPPDVAALLRFGCGAVVLLLWLAASRAIRALRRETSRRPRSSAQGRYRVLIAGGLCVFLFNLLFFWGLHLAPAVDAAIIVPTLSPVFTAAAAAVILREVPSRRRLWGLATGIVGAAAFLANVASASADRQVLGDMAYVAGAAVWAAYTLIGRTVLSGMDPLTAIAGATATGSVMLGAMAIPGLASVSWSAVPPDVWITLAYLATGPTAVAYVLYYRGIRDVGPVRASIMMFLIPVFGAAGSIIVLDESLTPPQTVGAALMLVGAVIAQLPTAAKSPAPVDAARHEPTVQAIAGPDALDASNHRCCAESRPVQSH